MFLRETNVEGEPEMWYTEEDMKLKYNLGFWTGALASGVVTFIITIATFAIYGTYYAG